MNKLTLEKIFDFLGKAGKLKMVERYTKLQNGKRETSAAHSWRLTLLVLILVREFKIKISLEKVLKIALVHDLAESLTGDIDAIRVARGEVSKEEKQRLELAAAKKISGKLAAGLGSEIFSLWQEYEEGKTKTARLVKAADKLETLIQLLESGYKTYDEPKFIANYADQATRNFSEFLPVLKMIKLKLKKEFKKGKIEWRKEYALNK